MRKKNPQIIRHIRRIKIALVMQFVSLAAVAQPGSGNGTPKPGNYEDAVRLSYDSVTKEISGYVKMDVNELDNPKKIYRSCAVLFIGKVNGSGTARVDFYNSPDIKLVTTGDEPTMQIRNLFWMGWLVLGANPAIGQRAMIHDTAVNKIKLGDRASTEKLLGPRIREKHFEADGLLPRIEIINRDSTQVLRLLVDYGGAMNAADQFQIVAIDKRYKFPRKAVRMNIDSFTTSRKISLFLKKESVIKVLGKGYKTLGGKGGDEELFFESSETDDFVKRHNEYKYFIQCVFRNGLLVNYWFGFESV